MAGKRMQRDVIVDFMESHKDLARGQLSPEQSAVLWEEIAKLLNDIGPAVMTVDQWKINWTNKWKSANYRSERAAEGAIDARNEPYKVSSGDRRILAIVGKPTPEELIAQNGGQLLPLRPLSARRLEKEKDGITPGRRSSKKARASDAGGLPDVLKESINKEFQNIQKHGVHPERSLETHGPLPGTSKEAEIIFEQLTYPKPTQGDKKFHPDVNPMLQAMQACGYPHAQNENREFSPNTNPLVQGKQVLGQYPQNQGKEFSHNTSPTVHGQGQYPRPPHEVREFSLNTSPIVQGHHQYPRHPHGVREFSPNSSPTVQGQQVRVQYLRSPYGVKLNTSPTVQGNQVLIQSPRPPHGVREFSPNTSPTVQGRQVRGQCPRLPYEVNPNTSPIIQGKQVWLHQPQPSHEGKEFLPTAVQGQEVGVQYPQPSNEGKEFTPPANKTVQGKLLYVLYRQPPQQSRELAPNASSQLQTLQPCEPKLPPPPKSKEIAPNASPQLQTLDACEPKLQPLLESREIAQKVISQLPNKEACRRPPQESQQVPLSTSPVVEGPQVTESEPGSLKKSVEPEDSHDAAVDRSIASVSCATQTEERGEVDGEEEDVSAAICYKYGRRVAECLMDMKPDTFHWVQQQIDTVLYQAQFRDMSDLEPFLSSSYSPATSPEPASSPAVSSPSLSSPDFSPMHEVIFTPAVAVPVVSQVTAANPNSSKVFFTLK